MDWVTIALAIHVLAVVLWIGGVAMVTTVLLPALRAGDPAAGIRVFFAIERRFAWQARATVLVAGASGFYMVDRLALWPAFGSIAYWWLDAMAGLWALFMLVLFVAEPLFFDRLIAALAARAPARTFALLLAFHRVLLALAIVTILGAVTGSHGL
jgi:uncharacterized membrane protein